VDIYFFLIHYFSPKKLKEKTKEHLVKCTRIIPAGYLVGGRERERERERTKPNQTKPKHTTLVKGRGGELLSNESANLFENLNHHLKIYGQSWNPPSFLP